MAQGDELRGAGRTLAGRVAATGRRRRRAAAPQRRRRAGAVGRARWRRVGVRATSSCCSRCSSIPGSPRRSSPSRSAAQSLALGLIALSLTFLGRLRRHGVARADDGGRHRRLHGRDLRHQRHAEISLGWPWWLAVVLALADRARCAATLIGWLSVRTEGIYTIMITLAIGVAFFYLAQQNYALFNGFQGFQKVCRPWCSASTGATPMPFYYLALFCALAGYFFVKYLVRAPFGIALQGIRDNPRRMSALGFNVDRASRRRLRGGRADRRGRRRAAGLVQRPDHAGLGRHRRWLINILIIAVLGGMRHPIGPFIGAIVFVLLQNFAIDLVDRERFNLVIGGVFLVIVLFSPDGLLGWWAGSRLGDAAPGAGAHVRTGSEWRSAAFHKRGRRAAYSEEEETMTSANAGCSSRLLAGAAVATVAVGGRPGAGDRQDRPAGHARRAVRGRRPGRHARRRARGEGAQRHGRRARRSRSSRPRPTPSPTWRSTPPASWSSRTRSQIMVGPLSGSEGIAVKDYSKSQPSITFINGSSGAQATTLVNPSPNFFRFNTEGAQWMVGLGEYALNDKGYKKMALIAEDYAFPYSQVQGFMAELLQARRQGHAQGVGAARRQGLLLGDRQAPEGRRRAAGRAGRRRRGELPHPVRAGRRRQADGRRLDHGRPDRAQLQGQAARVAARHAVGRPDGRQLSTRRSGRSSSPTTRRTSRTASRARRSSPTSTTST